MAKDVKARYAILRVDDKCPIIEDLDCCSCDDGACDDCKLKAEIGNYGDTKEQLIKKVETAIKRKSRRGEILFSFLDKKYRIEKVFDIKVLAKEIVEFLGVEDGRKNI